MARELAERDRIRSAHGVHLGFDVGKSFHWACALKGEEAVVDRAVANRRDDVRDAIGEAVDERVRRVARLADSRARARLLGR